MDCIYHLYWSISFGRVVCVGVSCHRYGWLLEMRWSSTGELLLKTRLILARILELKYSGALPTIREQGKPVVQ